MNISIRSELKEDYREVEEVTREAFWNLYVPGCNEHYLAHRMREHSDFLPLFDFVAVHKNKIIGNIMYTKSYVLDECNNRIDTVSFGPLSVLPDYQRKGVGSSLLRHSINALLKNRYKAIIIYGAPYNYCKHGFKSSFDFNISDQDSRYPYGLLVLELEKDVFKGNRWKYYPSDVYNIDPIDAEEYDKQFKFKLKEYTYTQEIFSIAFRAYLA